MSDKTLTTIETGAAHIAGLVLSDTQTLATGAQEAVQTGSSFLAAVPTALEEAKDLLTSLEALFKDSGAFEQGMQLVSTIGGLFAKKAAAPAPAGP